MAKLTIVGMYNYDQSLFDGLTFPTGIDKDIAVNEILMRSGEFCALYTDPIFMKLQIGIWGQKHERTFKKWIDALSMTYNPLENYDRQEITSGNSTKTTAMTTTADYSDNRTVDLTDELTHDTESKRTADLNEKTTNNTTDTNGQMFPGNDETLVSAYDSSTYEPKEKQTHDMGTVELSRTGTVDLDTTGTDTYNVTGTDTTTHDGTDNRAVSGTLSDASGSEQLYDAHNSRVHGNIGVTTSQQMLQAELDLQRWNIYEHIADIFVDEFCIQIY